MDTDNSAVKGKGKGGQRMGGGGQKGVGDICNSVVTKQKKEVCLPAATKAKLMK